MILANIFRLKFSTFTLNVNPLYYSRWNHVEKKVFLREGEKP